MCQDCHDRARAMLVHALAHASTRPDVAGEEQGAAALFAYLIPRLVPKADRAQDERDTEEAADHLNARSDLELLVLCMTGAYLRHELAAMEILAARTLIERAKAGDAAAGQAFARAVATALDMAGSLRELGRDLGIVLDAFAPPRPPTSPSTVPPGGLVS